MDIDSAWNIIERVLHDRIPDVAQTLRGPVSEEHLQQLSSVIGKELPKDLVASLRRHDGQNNPTRLLDLYDHHTLLSAEAMIEASNLRVDALGDDVNDQYDWMVPDKVRTIMNCRGWLQFTDVEGDGYALDLDPLPAGVAGQVIFLPIDGPTPQPEFSSFGDWLSSYAQRLDAGEFRIDDTIGLWLNH